MSAALKMLRSTLARSFARGPVHPETWFDSRGMERALEQVVRVHGGAAIDVDQRTIQASVAEFRRTGRIGSFRQLKYVCLGVGSIDPLGWCVLSDNGLRDEVVAESERQAEPHRRLRCFQALLSAYFSFPLGDEHLKPEAEAGWKALRDWLSRQRVKMSGMIDPTPPWFEALGQYADLLTARPCDKFVPDLMRGDASGLESAMKALAISRDSWVMDAAVFAQMQAATRLSDQPFREALPRLLGLALGQAGVEVGEPLRIRCVAALVSRYARCSATPEHPELRDAAVSTIGNPWLRRVRWEAHVVGPDQQPDVRAREMVFAWLKSRLIQDFFELLSVEGAADTRRLAYWLRFAPFIDDMWFALGTEARTRRDELFSQFRKRARGRLLSLGGTTRDNNAFMMKVGGILAVEFGATGHAFYPLKWDDLSPHLKASLTSGNAAQSIAIGELKPHTYQRKKKAHTDSPSLTVFKSWEQKFDDELLPVFDVRPDVRPACLPDLERLLKGRDVEVRDHRAAGGALHLTPEAELNGIAHQLQLLGFIRHRGRGWTKE